MINLSLVIISFFLTVSQLTRAQAQLCVATGNSCRRMNCCKAEDSCHRGICETCSFWICTVNENCCVPGDHCSRGLCRWCALSGEPCVESEGCCRESEVCLRGRCTEPSNLGEVCKIQEQCTGSGQTCHGGICRICSRSDRSCTPTIPCCNSEPGEDRCIEGFCRKCCQRGEACQFTRTPTCCNPQDVWRWEQNGVKHCVEN